MRVLQLTYPGTSVRYTTLDTLPTVHPTIRTRSPEAYYSRTPLQAGPPSKLEPRIAFSLNYRSRGRYCGTPVVNDSTRVLKHAQPFRHKPTDVARSHHLSSRRQADILHVQTNIALQEPSRRYSGDTRSSKLRFLRMLHAYILGELPQHSKAYVYTNVTSRLSRNIEIVIYVHRRLVELAFVVFGANSDGISLLRVMPHLSRQRPAEPRPSSPVRPPAAHP